MNAVAELQNRVDRKYVVGAQQLERLFHAIGTGVEVLEIGHQRLLTYQSTYLDSADLITYRAHLQRRRKRYKVRLRHYVDTDTRFLEIKHKGPRQDTLKTRTKHDDSTVGRAGLSFAADVVARAYGFGIPELRPTAQTTNRRSTFLMREHSARFTVDVNVAFRAASGRAGLRPGYAVLETKSLDGRTPVDAALRDLRIRPTSISKYCTAVALLSGDLPSNPWHRVLRAYFHREPPPAGETTTNADDPNRPLAE